MTASSTATLDSAARFATETLELVRHTLPAVFGGHDGVLEERVEPALQRLRTLTWALDDMVSLPSGRTVGLGPVIGAIPVVGPLFPTLVAAYTLFEAAHVGAPREMLIRFLLRHIVDWVAARIPVLGALFDAWYKASARNLDDLESWLEATLG